MAGIHRVRRMGMRFMIRYITTVQPAATKVLPICDNRNFIYYGTQMEADRIKKAFENDELHEMYDEQKESLQQIVDMTSANEERRNSTIINVAATILAVVQIKEFVVLLFDLFYKKIGVPNEPGNHTFDVLLFGVTMIIILVFVILRGKRRYDRISSLGGKRR